MLCKIRGVTGGNASWAACSSIVAGIGRYLSSVEAFGCRAVQEELSRPWMGVPDSSPSTISDSDPDSVLVAYFTNTPVFSCRHPPKHLTIAASNF